MPADKLCGDCAHWWPDDYPRLEFGGCHRYPPQFATNWPGNRTEVERLKAKWPTTLATDWCDEFSAKPAATE